MRHVGKEERHTCAGYSGICYLMYPALVERGQSRGSLLLLADGVSAPRA